jgi:hypothetical protein
MFCCFKRYLKEKKNSKNYAVDFFIESRLNSHLPDYIEEMKKDEEILSEADTKLFSGWQVYFLKYLVIDEETGNVKSVYED